MSRSASEDLRRLALGVVLPGFLGTDLPQWLVEALGEGLAGVCLFGQNVRDDAQVTALSAAVRAARPRALVASDEEGGTVTRLDAASGSPWPAPAALGAIDDPATTREVARRLGTAARERGVDLVLAPVADVASEPDNPVIGERSFGADPALVARHVAAAVEGLHAAGVVACVKHFPGHGATRTDSHLELPVVEVDEATWRARELPPFRAAVEAGVRCVMTAHVVLRALDDRPATLSARVLGLLRDELGFDGRDQVVVTDAVDMRAISEGVGRAAGAVLALAAGADLVCLGNPAYPDHYDDGAALHEVVEAVVAAVEAGELPLPRLAQAAARVAALADTASRLVPEALPADDLAHDPAALALSVEGDPRLGRDAQMLVVQPETSMAAGARASTLTLLEPSAVQVHDVREAEAHALAAGGDLAVAVEGRSTPGTRAVVAAVLRNRPDAVVVHLGPDDHRGPARRHAVVSHGGGLASARAVLHRLGLEASDDHTARSTR
ncbi:glycoside hydrolase family 3 protein [Nocardioides nanhaiensis]|uniref:Glycoside hydrolase family 3 protein n=1 Tax=Nocardioides nanhaiensis TaxID=1476871 RepID=A0ABP8WYT5_9ACTN